MTGETDINLKGNVAVVTGSSRGLGRAIAARLAACGAHVVLNGSSASPALEEVRAELAGSPGGASVLPGDVRDGTVVERLVQSVVETHGRLDVFVHNAASMTPMAAAGADTSSFQDELRLALNPLLHAAPGLADAMSDGGRIIAVSSNGAHEAIPGYVATGVAKAALEALVRYLAVELGRRSITVNAVATHLLDKGPETSNPDVARFLASRTPNGRLTRPDDVAAAVALLCTSDASWIQGQVLTVDGGLGLVA